MKDCCQYWAEKYRTENIKCISLDNELKARTEQVRQLTDVTEHLANKLKEKEQMAANQNALLKNS